MYTKPKFSAFLALISLVYHFVFPQYAWADSVGPLNLIEEPKFESIQSSNLPTLYGQTLIQTANPETAVVLASRRVIVTAYSSTPDQTDSTPFITASGAYVRDGIVAANFLRFGTKVRLPELYGDKIFIVEDRMAPKNSHKMDIWFPTRWEAINFGVKKTKIEILEN